MFMLKKKSFGRGRISLPTPGFKLRFVDCLSLASLGKKDISEVNEL